MTQTSESAKFSVPTGTVFHLPEIFTSLPEACNPSCADLDRASDDLARPYLTACFGDQDRAERYLRQRISHFACVCYPNTSSQDGRAQKLSNLIIPAILYDDTFSKPNIQDSIAAATDLHDRWVSVFTNEWTPPDIDANNANKKAPAEDAAFSLVHRAVEAAASVMHPSLERRVRQCWIDLAAGHLDEAMLRNNRETPDLLSYMEKRPTNVYGWWLTTLAEYGAGIDLGEELPENPQVLAARRAVINHVTLVNDLYSFAKELDAGEADMNVIAVLMQGPEKLNLQGAVDMVVDMIHNTERIFLEARDEILAEPLAVDSDEQSGIATLLRAYLYDGLPYIRMGNLRWSQLTPRYFDDRHDGGSFTSGKVTIAPKPTVHAPLGSSAL